MSDTFTIEEAAAATGVTAHTLRYYERIGLIPPVERATSGHRRYSEADLGTVRFLTLLRATGMPIREMTEFVTLTRAGDHTIPWRVEVLERHRDALRARMEADTGHLAALDRKIDIYLGLLAERSKTA
jgi:DNA-binding transcriptional MerR regulator